MGYRECGSVTAVFCLVSTLTFLRAVSMKNTDFQSASLPKGCVYLNVFKCNFIKCVFGRLRKGDAFPQVDGPKCNSVAVVWNLSCVPPYVNLPDGYFSRVANLEYLALGGCLISHFTSKTFANLKKNRGFSLELFSADLYIRKYIKRQFITIFEPNWLEPLKGMRILKMTHYNVFAFPPEQFCGLLELEKLTLTNDKLNSSGGLGIQSLDSKTTKSACLPNLIHLNISYNNIPILNLPFRTDLPKLKSLIAQNCSISKIDGLDSNTIMKLQEINLMNNALSSFRVKDVANCNNSSLSWLQLQDNQLRNISPGLFMCTKNLRHLNLAQNHLTNVGLSYAGLPHLRKVRYLNLNGNNITVLSKVMFRNMFDLKELSCRGCNMRIIEKDVFTKSKELTTVDLSKNSLAAVEFTKAISSLKELYLNENNLQQMPTFIGSWSELHTLNLSDNNIQELQEPLILGRLSNLTILQLSKNNISYIGKLAFYSVCKLDQLDISQNSIHRIDTAAFSESSITQLNLNYNFISELDESIWHSIHLTHLHLRGNRITSLILLNSNGLQNVDLSCNQISSVVDFCFNGKNLQFVNLTYNEIPFMDITSFMTAIKTKSDARLIVLLEGNPLQCNCHNTIMRILDSDITLEGFYRNHFHELYPHETAHQIDLIVKGFENVTLIKVPDLDKVYCNFYPDLTKKSSLGSLPVTDFLCPYEVDDDHSGCSHQENNSCSSACNKICDCYKNRVYKRNVVYCTGRNLTAMPHNLPKSATEIMLNLNQIEVLEKQIFEESRRNHLNKLFLDNNNIHLIENIDFGNDSLIEVFTLHDNRLRALDLTIFDHMPYLRHLSLYGNPWECDCTFGHEFQNFLRHNWNILAHSQPILCRYFNYGGYGGSSTNAFIESHNVNASFIIKPVLDIDFSHCHNATFLQVIEHRDIVSVPVVASITSVCVFIVCLVITVFRLRFLLKVWAYNQFGTCCHHETKDNDDKPYDVFIAYAWDDDMFVVTNLLPELEQGEKQYKVLVKSRDWPGGECITDTTIASVEQSKRTILVVSENYFESPWCQYDFQVALFQVLKDKQMRLIIVLTDINLKARLESDVKLYLNTGAYLVYGERWFWKKLRYYLADDPRGSGAEFTPLTIYRGQAV